MTQLLLVLLLILNFLATHSEAQADVAIPRIETWLNDHPRITSAINWEGYGPSVKFVSWTATQKQELYQAFEKVWLWQDRYTSQNENPLQLEMVPENLNPAKTNPQAPWEVRISKKDAWGLYLSSVAQSLAFELKNEMKWSLGQLSDFGLEIVLSSSRMFFSSNKGEIYRFSTNITGYAVPAPATFTYAFLKKNQLLASDQTQTIERLLQWCRQHLEHFAGPHTMGNALEIWQYPGWPPIQKVISGTVALNDPHKERIHYTGGCWGTVAFLINVLRSVNIPVELKEVCSDMTHAAAHFVEQGLYLSHGDDPYNQISRRQPQFPIKKLLFPRNQWASWFENGGVLACQKLGKTPEEIWQSQHK